MVNAALDERLGSYALIGRTAIEVTVPFLTRLFSERFERLNQVNVNASLSLSLCDNTVQIIIILQNKTTSLPIKDKITR